MVRKICKYEVVEAYECPFCGALVLAEMAEEKCWSCDRKVAYPDDPVDDENYKALMSDDE
jgi:hypothetical protein